MADIEAKAFFRVGNVAQIREVIARLGLETAGIMAAVGHSELVFDDPETLLPVNVIDTIISQIEVESGCEDVGLRLGTLPTNLGLPEFLMRSAPTVRDGIADFANVMNALPRAGGVRFTISAGEATLGYTPVVPGLRAAHHMADFGVAQLQRLLKESCGPDFKPVRILLPRRPPADASPYRAYFGVLPKFNAAEASVTFDSKFLPRAPVNAEARLYVFLKRQIPAETSLTTIVTRMLPSMILTGKTSKSALAEALKLHPRTLHRRLAAEGSGHQALVNRVRGEMGRQLVENTTMSMSEIAMQLGYSDLSAFSRQFNKQCGMPPQKWRAAKER